MTAGVVILFINNAVSRLHFQGSWRAAPERLSQICHKTQTANSVCGLERKKRAQRKRGSANSGDSFRRGRFCRASGGPIFPSCRKRWGEKRGAGMRLVLSASEFRRGPGFQASFHSEVTLRVSAARRLIRGAKFAAGCHRTFAVNRRCRPDLLVCTFLRGGFFARRG